MSDYRNRIKDYRTVDAAQIRRNPANFRRHPDAQRAALRSILGDVGQVAPLLVLEDGDGYLLLDGEARWGEGGAWPVAVLDLTPDEAATVLAMLDKIGADAEIDPAALMALLDALPSEARETTGAAWSDAALAAIIRDTGEPMDPSEMWKGMPDFEQEDKAYKLLRVYFVNEQDYAAFADLLGQQLTEKTTGIWYPAQEKIELSSYRVRDES